MEMDIKGQKTTIKLPCTQKVKQAKTHRYGCENCET